MEKAAALDLTNQQWAEFFKKRTALLPERRRGRREGVEFKQFKFNGWKAFRVERHQGKKVLCLRVRHPSSVRVLPF